MKTISTAEMLKFQSVEENFFEDLRKAVNKNDEWKLKTSSYWLKQFMSCDTIEDYNLIKSLIKREEKNYSDMVFLTAYEIARSLSAETKRRFRNYLRCTDYCKKIYTTKKEGSNGQIVIDGQKLYWIENTRFDLVGLINSFRSASLFMRRFGFAMYDTAKTNDETKKITKAKESLKKIGLTVKVIDHCKDLRALALNFGIDYDTL